MRKIIIISLSFCALLLIGGVGYFGFRYYQKINKEAVAKEAATQALISKQQQALVDAEKTINDVKTQSQQEINNLKTQSEQNNVNLQNSINSVKNNLNNQTTNAEPNMAQIVKEWRPLVAHIVCEWRYSDTGEAYLKQAGSGLTLKINGEIKILTNAHVITDEGKYSPWSCDIKLLDDTNIFSAAYGTDAFKMSSSDVDWGTIKISSPDTYVENITSPGVKYCSHKPSIGDNLVILGYPGIGSQSDITATEGIISGYDGSYYITSAKVEHGNSGGVAILLKDDCYLGIPSFVDVGQLESLARILDVNVFVK